MSPLRLPRRRPVFAVLLVVAVGALSAEAGGKRCFVRRDCRAQRRQWCCQPCAASMTTAGPLCYSMPWNGGCDENVCEYKTLAGDKVYELDNYDKSCKTLSCRCPFPGSSFAASGLKCVKFNAPDLKQQFPLITEIGVSPDQFNSNELVLTLPWYKDGVNIGSAVRLDAPTGVAARTYGTLYVPCDGGGKIVCTFDIQPAAAAMPESPPTASARDYYALTMPDYDTARNEYSWRHIRLPVRRLGAGADAFYVNVLTKNSAGGPAKSTCYQCQFTCQYAQ